LSGVIVAIIGATATVTAAGIAAFFNLRKGQQQIHVLVNNRLTEALLEIKRLGGDRTKF